MTPMSLPKSLPQDAEPVVCSRPQCGVAMPRLAGVEIRPGRWRCRRCYILTTNRATRR